MHPARDALAGASPALSFSRRERIADGGVHLLGLAAVLAGGIHLLGAAIARPGWLTLAAVAPYLPVSYTHLTLPTIYSV